MSSTHVDQLLRRTRYAPELAKESVQCALVQLAGKDPAELDTVCALVRTFALPVRICGRLRREAHDGCEVRPGATGLHHHAVCARRPTVRTMARACVRTSVRLTKRSSSERSYHSHLPPSGSSPRCTLFASGATR